METSPIGDFDDPRIGDYRNLKDATLAATRKRFIVEGSGNLRVLLTRSAHQPDSILLSERSFAALEPELASLAPPCPIYVAEQALLDRVVGFPIHRGCLAACGRAGELDPLELARRLLAEHEAPRLVVLEGITNHDNVGAIFRNAMALGGHGVLLCPRTCDPLYRKAIRTSMGGSLCVPFARCEDLAELLRALGELGFEILALDPGDPGVEIGTLRADGVGPVALVAGTEGPGLTPPILAAADRRARIAMEPGVDSLNVSAAVAIALHQLRRIPQVASQPAQGAEA